MEYDTHTTEEFNLTKKKQRINKPQERNAPHQMTDHVMRP